MPADNQTHPFRLHLARVVVLALLLVGCDRPGKSIRHGSLRYDVEDVFGAGTPACLLAHAAAHGDTKQIHSQISASANVNLIGRYEITPLWWAAWAGNFQGFSALLEEGANPNVQRTSGYPIMHLVADMRDSRLLEAALKRGGDPNLRDLQSGLTPLFPAVQNGRNRQVDLLLRSGSDPNAQMPISRQTLPMVAIGSRADYQLAYQLLERGADPKAKTTHGDTLADFIELRSINASNNADPWRKKVIDYLQSHGLAVNGNGVK